MDRKSTNVIAIIAFICSFLGIGSIIIFCMFVSLLGMDFGIFIAIPMVLFPLAFVLGILSIPIIFLCHGKRTSLIFSLFAILLSTPVVLLFLDYLRSPNIREENKKKYSAL